MSSSYLLASQYTHLCKERIQKLQSHFRIGIWHPSLLLLFLLSFTISNMSSETPGPIKAKLHVEHPLNGVPSLYKMVQVA